jgi:hypothetical protein
VDGCSTRSRVPSEGIENEAHTREKRKETGKKHLIDTMVPSSTSRRAVLCTCTLLLVTATSEVPVMGDE